MLLAVDVAAVFTDGREDHTGDPVLELLRLGLVGAHDELVEAAFADDGERGDLDQSHEQIAVVDIRLPSSPLLRCVQHLQLIGDTTVAKAFDTVDGAANIRSHEPRLTVDLYRADAVVLFAESERSQRLPND